MINFSQDPKTLCIFRLSAIGDVSHILPIIHTLKKAWPKTRITWIIGKLEYQLVKSLADVEFIVFDKSKGWRAFRDLRRQLKGRRFDILLMMQAALRANLASLFVSARYRLGFDRQRAIDYQWLFSNQKINGDERVHVLDIFFQFLEAIGIEQKHYIWDLPLEATDQQFADKLISSMPCAIINPCSSVRKNNWRNWSIERYAKIADYLHNLEMQVLITGGPSSTEIKFCRAVTEKCKSTPQNLAGKTTLGQLLALIKRSKFIIAPDTGPAHMATIVDTPAIALFASSNPERSGPYKSRHILVNNYPQALQQYNHKSVAQARWGERVRVPEVMELISVELVKQKIDPLISNAPEFNLDP
jgi:heptosyltransferase I